MLNNKSCMSQGIVYNENYTFTIYPRNFRRAIIIQILFIIFRIVFCLCLVFVDLRLAALGTFAISAITVPLTRHYNLPLGFTSILEETYVSFFVFFICVIFSLLFNSTILP